VPSEHRVIRGRKERWDHRERKEHRDRKATPGLKVPSEHRVIRGRKERWDLKATSDHKGRRVPTAIWDLQVLKGRRENRARLVLLARRGPVLG